MAGHVGMPASPDALPDGLMVFDGVCNFCATSVRLVLAMDRRETIRFTPVQSAYGEALCRRSGIDPKDPATFLFFDHGRPLRESDAMLALARRFGWPWQALAWLKIVPRVLRDPAYRLLARNRYRLFGKRETCMVPTPELRRRFVVDLPSAPR